jgi:hypothetical protein
MMDGEGPPRVLNSAGNILITTLGCRGCVCATVVSSMEWKRLPVKDMLFFSFSSFLLV